MESNASPVSASEEPKIPSSAPTSINPNRLSLPYLTRVSTVTAGAFFTGMFLGLSHGMKTAGLRFRAENSHRFPTTSTGWYLYHKSKNYHMMYGGVKEGLKMGSKLAFWAGGFFMVEEAVDRLRGTKDFVSTLVAGLGVAGGFSAWSRFPLITAARTAKLGLYTSLAFGILQDVLSLARGRRLGYIDFVLGVNRQRNYMDRRTERENRFG